MYLKDNMCTDNRRRTTSAEKKQNEKIEQFQRYHRHTYTHTQTFAHIPTVCQSNIPRKYKKKRNTIKKNKKKINILQKKPTELKRKKKSMKNKNSIATKTIRPKNLLNNEQ